VRLDKCLSVQANLSRSQAAKLIRDGRVILNNEAVKDPARHIGDRDTMSLDGKVLQYGMVRHVMLNKPSGVLTAARDAKARTVMDLMPPQYIRMKCMPAGRLDKDTEGLLLLTTDGVLAHRMLSPKRMVMKEYIASVTGRLDEEDCIAFSEGIPLQDFTSLPAQLKIISSSEDSSDAVVVIHEGKNRQIRRMFASRGHDVVSLKRIRIGPIRLDESLSPGEYRELTEEELAALKEAVGLG
jgi:16S rRNA pseudouridine516 synthase